jgi:hypothetical protein
MSGTFSLEPLKNKVIRNIVNSQTKEQLESSMRYAQLAGLQDDELVKDWLKFKKQITNFNSPF